MEDPKDRKKGDVVMFIDSKQIVSFISKKKSLFQPFDDHIIDFLDNVSKEANKLFKKKNLLDLFYLSKWCSRKQLLKKKDIYSKGITFKVGRGLAYHNCPSNVPTNFVYSFFFGLLSGNCNIVKIPSKDFIETKIILSLINKVVSKKEYSDIRNSNAFVYFDRENKDILKEISINSDVRLLWGGDQSVNELKKIPTSTRCLDLVFSDRYSFSVISLESLKCLSLTEFKILVKNFFYDSYYMLQNACNSPHFVFWQGREDKKITSKFWNILNKIADKKISFSDNQKYEKFSNLNENVIKMNLDIEISKYSDYLTVINVNKFNKLSNKIECLRGKNGIFFEKNINNLNYLRKYITKKCQTVSYFGFSKKDFESLILKNNLKGGDRFVPIGQSMNIDLIWDSYDLINVMSRSVEILNIND